MSPKKTSSHFEKNLTDLEKIVERLESGELSLEESLTHFERGILLTRVCQKQLNEAEQKIQILLDKNDAQELQAFTPEDSNGD